MALFYNISKILVLFVLIGTFSACDGKPRAVMLPLQYPDGTHVRTTSGETAMAGYQTYGSVTHARATAIYEQARPPSCVTCARVGAVVTEPSILRQATGVIGTAAVGAGAVMTGIGVMDYGDAAQDGKLGTNISQNNTSSQNVTNPKTHHVVHQKPSDGHRDRDWSRDRDWDRNKDWSHNTNINHNNNWNSNQNTNTNSNWNYNNNTNVNVNSTRDRDWDRTRLSYDHDQNRPYAW